MPDTRSGKTPNDIIFTYKPKILLDLINPKVISKNVKSKSSQLEESTNSQSNFSNEEHKSTNSQSHFNKEAHNQSQSHFQEAHSQSKTNANESKVIKSKFSKGDNVFYRNHFKEYIRWIPAKVIAICSPLTYLINVNNKVRFVHQNQIRISKLDSHFHPSILILPHSEFYKSQVVKENFVSNQTDKNVPVSNNNGNSEESSESSELEEKLEEVKTKIIKLKQANNNRDVNYHRDKPKRIRKPVDRFCHSKF